MNTTYGISKESIISLNYNGLDSLYFISVPHVAKNLRLTFLDGDVITYERYDFNRKLDLQSLILSYSQSCNVDIFNHTIDDSYFNDYDFLRLEIPYLGNVSEVIVILKCDLPPENRLMKIFKNRFVGVYDTNNNYVNIILPPDAKPWYVSRPYRYSESNDNLILHFDNLREDVSSSIDITYGTTSEYLFHKFSVSSVVNDYLTLLILLLSITLTLSLYFWGRKQYIKSNMVFVFFFFIISVYTIFLLVSIHTIPPFLNSAYKSILLRFLFVLFMALPLYFQIIGSKYIKRWAKGVIKRNRNKIIKNKNYNFIKNLLHI